VSNHDPIVRSRAALGAIVAAALSFAATAPSAATLFYEDFDGYTYFPSQIPSGDYVNVGLPKQSEGADERWYGIRLQNASSGGSSIDGDLAVQQFGGGSNLTPVGRVEDDAGFAFKINTIGYTGTTLEFDWRTFKAESTDRLRAGYFVGNIPAFESSDYFNAISTAYDWPAWTPLLSGSASNSFTHQSYALPNDQASVWVVFWLDNGEGDYGKVDNVSVTAVPEPAAAALVAVAGVLITARRRTRR
jgi:hypothetical protein